MASAIAMPTESVVDAETIMLHPRRNRREKSRTLLILPVSIGLGYREHQAVIRDISASGMFLFSNFTPPNRCRPITQICARMEFASWNALSIPRLPTHRCE